MSHTRYFLGSLVIIILLFNASVVFAQQAEDVPVHQTSRTAHFFDFFKNIFSLPKESFLGNVMSGARAATSVKTDTLQSKTQEKDIKQIESKLTSVATSLRIQNTILENPVLNKLVPESLANITKIEKAVVDKNRLIIDLAEKSPKNAIAYIEKNIITSLQNKKDAIVLQEFNNLTIDIVHGDIFGKEPRAIFQGHFLDSKGETLVIISEQLAGKGGSYVTKKITGYRVGDFIIAKEIVGLESLSARPLHETRSSGSESEDYNVLVLLVNYLDSPAPEQLIDAETAHDLIFNGEVHDFFYEQSYGKMNLVGDVLGWYTVQTNGGILDANGNSMGIYCNPLSNGFTATHNNDATFRNQGLMDYLIANNVDISFYDHVLAIAHCKDIPVSGFAGKIAEFSGVIGWPDIGFASTTMVPFSLSRTPNGYLELGHISHELGHSLYGGPNPSSGMSYYLHANGLDCGDQVYAEEGAVCQNVEYGNRFDSLGRPAFSKHFHGVLKSALGWIPQENILTVTESTQEEGIHILEPLETMIGDNGGYKIAKLQPAYLNNAPYVLEYRRAIGFDSNLNTPSLFANTDGLFIYKTSFNNSPNASLLDMNPTSLPWNEDSQYVALGVGQTFTDPELGITINTVTANPQKVFFQVTYGECERQSPALSWDGTFLSYPPQAGELKRLWTTIYYTDNDNIPCNNSTFTMASVSDIPITTIIPTYSAQDNNHPGNTNSLGFFVIVPVGTPTGTYNVHATITNVNSGQSSVQVIPIVVE